MGVFDGGVGSDAGHHEEAAPARVVVDCAVVRGDGADLGDAAGVFGGEFEEGAAGIEEIAFGADFAVDADRAVGRGAVERGVTAREAPVFSLLVGVDHGSGIEADGGGGRGEVGVRPFRGGGVVGADELQVGAQLVERVADGDAEGFFLGAAGVEEGTGAASGAEAGEAGVRGGGAGIAIAVGEDGGRVREVAGSADANPGRLLGGREGGERVARGGNFDAPEFGPLVVAAAVDFEGEGHGCGGVVGEVEETFVVAGEEEGVGGRVFFHGVIEPHGAAADDGAEAVELRGFDEPEVGLRLAGGGEGALGFAFVEELALGGVVAAEDDAVAPAGEVADDFEVIGTWRQAGGVGGVEVFREAPECAVHRHEQIGFTDVADAGPLGVPAVGAIVGVAGFREAVGVPRAAVEDLKDE